MDKSIDYRMVCRTCLASEAEFYKLDARIFVDDGEDKVSFIECLKYCTKLEDVAEFPIYICTQCSTALQVAYNFMKNALEAHEILRQKLCPPICGTRANGQFVSSEERKVSFRCKICGEKVDSKKSLKEHVKLHLDLISYSCEVCLFKTKKRSALHDHYLFTHGFQATKDQLKPQTIQQQQQQQQQQQYTQLPTTTNNCINNPIQIQTVENQFSIPQSHQPMNVAQFLSSSSSSASQLPEIPLEMATVIASRPNALDAPIRISSKLQNFGNEFNLGSNLSIGNEFVVMQDGTVQEVMSNGVVINYINTGGPVELDNGIFINNLMMQPPEAVANMTDSVNVVNMPDNSVNMVSMMDGVNMVNMTDSANVVNMPDNSLNMVSMMDGVNMIHMDGGANMVNGPIQCEMINPTNDALNVGLESGTVNMDIDDIIVEENVENVTVTEEPISNNATEAKVINVPTKHIRCKMCKSLFSTQESLKEHMLTHNEIPHFFCEICNFYTFFKIDLTQHYKTKHSVAPNNRQLQPKNKVNFNVPEGAKKVFLCELCIYDTPVKAILRRHYLSKHQIEATEVQLRPVRVTTSSSSADSGDDMLKHSKKNKTKTVETNTRNYPNGLNCTKCSKTFYWENELNEHHKQHTFEESLVEHTPPTISVSVTVNNVGCSNSTGGVDLSSFPDDLDVDVEKLIACTELKATIIERPPPRPQSRPQSPQPPRPVSVVDGSRNVVPPDAIPQIVETDSIVDNILNFDFNGDAIFDDDSEENDDEEFQDLVLTTDDEQDYARETSGSSVCGQQNTFCVQCNKKFATYYQFENHMFVHRGLAPYRCEMCTNLYNTKRDLIRHYHAVHKSFPTRDMIQAKGDKVPTEHTDVQQASNVEKSENIRLMCAKCPYEVIDINDLKAHLSVIHGIDDDNFVLQKLPYECPKCIRTFDSKSRLTRHIERNHSNNLICHEQKDNNDNVSCKRCGLNLHMSELNAHLLQCNNITSYDCLSCDLVFDTRTKLIEHKNQYHFYDIKQEESKEEQQHQQQHLTCKFCHGKYRSQYALKNHVKRHIARKHCCTLCPKTFICKAELENHNLTHTGEYPHECNVCQKVFRYVHHLKRHHFNKHETRRYVCEANNCQQSFTIVSEFKMHAASHAWNEFSSLYTCKYCSEELPSRELFRWHAKILHETNLTDAELDESKRNNS